MAIVKIKKGLDLPIDGKPVQEISQGNKLTSVALLGGDYVGMKPTLAVGIGDRVKLGQLLFTDKKIPSVRYTSPGSGTVASINRGLKRAFLSIIIDLDGDDEITFDSHKADQLELLEKDKNVSQLLESGLWTTLRTRPFSKVADPEVTPHSIFVTAMDTNPLAPSVETILKGNEQHFINGLKIISKLTDGEVFLCKTAGLNIPTTDTDSISVQEFSGPHPSGNVGTHIHFLDPVSRKKTVWYINAQDVVAIGILFTSGRLNVDRVISIAGPGVTNPRLLKTRIGASLTDLTKGELTEGENRIISGSVLSGHTASDTIAFLGRFHQQITVIEEGRKREFFGWVMPGMNVFSIKSVFLSALMLRKKFNFNSSLHGGQRGIIPIGSYEKVMPLDIQPTYLLRALAVDDVEEAEKLGCLELDEEDLALCTFVCPSKIEHGINLRRNLTLIEKEG